MKTKKTKRDSLEILRDRIEKWKDSNHYKQEQIIERELKKAEKTEQLKFRKQRKYMQRLGEIYNLRKNRKMTLEEIGKEYGISRERIRQIIK